MSEFDNFARGMMLLRVISGQTKKQIADKAGIHASVYTRLELNKDDNNPTLKTLIAIARAFGLAIEDIMNFPDAVDRLVLEFDQPTTPSEVKK